MSYGTAIRYKGYTLKSRIEFAWAQFFEGEGLDWEYEPRTFREDKTNYTPDFGLGLFLFVETKAYGAKNVDNAFCACPLPLLLIFGTPSRYYIRFKPAGARSFEPGHIRSWTLAYEKAAA